VAIENSTGEVRAMVGGRDYNKSPFNLATEGERQPGSSFKAFDLAGALQDGISPDSTWASKQKEFIVPHTGGHEKFIVHNDEGAYTGSNTLIGATAYSDNSIYAEVGLRVGTERIARLAHRMGITTPISTNPAMTIGGLKVGVTPLDMAHAYETIAHGGRRVSGTLAEAGSPVGIQEVVSPARSLPDGSRHDINRVVTKPVLAPDIAATETSVLETVLQYGTARVAAIGQFAAGKTGTTSNYGDAWFVGWDSKYTVAVWVGYPDGLVPMTTQFNGGPVLGGTFPALIWHDFMISALHVDKTRAEQAAAQAAARAAGKHGRSTTSGSEETPAPAGSLSGPSRSGEEGAAESHASPNGGGGGGGSEHGSSPSAPATPAPPSPSAPAAPSPPESSSPAPKSSGGGGASPEATGGVSPTP
jgi:penicillin-binding protein 1A